MMNMNRWTLGLCSLGLVSLGAVAQAEERNVNVTAATPTVIGGYVDTSAIWLMGSGDTLVGRSFDGSDKQDGFNLNVVSLTLEKALDETEWAAGYKAQLLFGPDASTLNSVSGLADGVGDFGVKNAYVALRAPVGTGLNFKVGVWDTVIGYEVFESGNNQHYSRSFGYFIEPIIHTGVLGSYDITEWLSVSAGIADGGSFTGGTYGNTINSRGAKGGDLTYVGSVALTAPQDSGWLEGAALYGGTVYTSMGGLSEDVVNLYAGATVPLPISGLGVGVAYDYRANGIFNESYENAIGGYLFWKATEKMKLAGRVEYATGSSGAYGVALAPGADNVQLLGVTATLDYRLWENVISRVEFRWDKDLNNDGLFLDGKAENAMSLALNLIYRF